MIVSASLFGTYTDIGVKSYINNQTNTCIIISDCLYNNSGQIRLYNNEYISVFGIPVFSDPPAMYSLKKTNKKYLVSTLVSFRKFTLW